MDEFIRMATNKLGIGESTARSAAGDLLQFINDRSGAGNVSGLLSKISGASDLMREARPAANTAGEVLGGLMNRAAAAVGGEIGAGLGLAGRLEQSGLDMGKAGSFVGMFVEFLDKKIGADGVKKILSQVPELSKLAG